jgi:DNA-directed RNA polymerase subunit RPC12/RpoP
MSAAPPTSQCIRAVKITLAMCIGRTEQTRLVAHLMVTSRSKWTTVKCTLLTTTIRAASRTSRHRGRRRSGFGTGSSSKPVSLMTETIKMRCQNCGHRFEQEVVTDKERQEADREGRPVSAVHCPKCNRTATRRGWEYAQNGEEDGQYGLPVAAVSLGKEESKIRNPLFSEGISFFVSARFGSPARYADELWRIVPRAAPATGPRYLKPESPIPL